MISSLQVFLCYIFLIAVILLFPLRFSSLLHPDHCLLLCLDDLVLAVLSVLQRRPWLLSLAAHGGLSSLLSLTWRCDEQHCGIVRPLLLHLPCHAWFAGYGFTFASDRGEDRGGRRRDALDRCFEAAKAERTTHSPHLITRSLSLWILTFSSKFIFDAPVGSHVRPRQTLRVRHSLHHRSILTHFAYSQPRKQNHSINQSRTQKHEGMTIGLGMSRFRLPFLQCLSSPLVCEGGGWYRLFDPLKLSDLSFSSGCRWAIHIWLLSTFAGPSPSSFHSLILSFVSFTFLLSSLLLFISLSSLFAFFPSNLLLFRLLLILFLSSSPLPFVCEYGGGDNVYTHFDSLSIPFLLFAFLPLLLFFCSPY